MNKNAFGLSRDIPAAVAREVRQRCGFGCVVCGHAIYQYEHLEPPFPEAREHDPAGIVLLCGGCHDRRTRGFLSRESVIAAAAEPKAKQTGYSFGPFDLGTGPLEVQLGPCRIIRTPVLVDAFDTPLLRIDPPETEGAPFRLSARMFNSNGDEILRIVENEWQISQGNWDVEVVGCRIILRRGMGDITLRLRKTLHTY